MSNNHPDYEKLLPRYQTIRDCINDDVAWDANTATSCNIHVRW
jgi:hypothetical protein